MSGKRSCDHDEAAHLATFESNLRHAVTRLVKEDIVGLIEPINPVSTPGYFLNNYPTGIILLSLRGSTGFLFVQVYRSLQTLIVIRLL